MNTLAFLRSASLMPHPIMLHPTPYLSTLPHPILPQPDQSYQPQSHTILPNPAKSPFGIRGGSFCRNSVLVCLFVSLTGYFTLVSILKGVDICVHVRFYSRLKGICALSSEKFDMYTVNLSV